MERELKNIDTQIIKLQQDINNINNSNNNDNANVNAIDDKNNKKKTNSKVNDTTTTTSVCAPTITANDIKHAKTAMETYRDITLKEIELQYENAKNNTKNSQLLYNQVIISIYR